MFNLTKFPFRIRPPAAGRTARGDRPRLLLSIGLIACLASGLRAQTITVNVNDTRQEIYGFGAGMKRQTTNLRNMTEPARTEVLNLMFRDVNTRILRTYLRHNHETANDNADPAVLNADALNWGAYQDDVWVYQQALGIAGSRLDTLYASCNTAPAWMKDNASIIGGSLTANTNTYNEFGEQIWGYLRYMKLTHGMDIRAVSIFNEPGYFPTHDSMNPSPTQAADILGVVGPYLKARYAENPTFTPSLLVGPDGESTASTISYLNSILANPGAAAATDIVGSHYYGGVSGDWTTMATKAGNRMLWQTEYARLSGASDDITDGLFLAGKMLDVLGNGAHAYIAFQWAVEGTDPAVGNGLIRIQGNTYVVPKRYHVFKQWANSVPPGSVRLSTTSTATGLKVTAYRKPDNTVVIQVINDGAGNMNGVVFNVPGASGTVQRSRTSSTLSASGLATITASNGTFANEVYNNTFTTYVVPIAPANRAPVFASSTLTRPEATSGASYVGQTLAGTATDADVGDTLTYAKVSGPTWLSVAANGTLSGTPASTNTGANSFSILVTDNAGATASATLNISVRAFPLPWDIVKVGTTNLSGSATHNNGAFTLAGSGILAGTADTGQFLYQTLTADGSITARITTLQNTGASSRVGVMVRNTLANNSAHVWMGMSGTNAYNYGFRTTAGGSSTFTGGGTGTVPNTWIRITRATNTFTCWKSADGVTWTKTGAVTTTFAATCYIGLWISSSSNTTTNTSTFNSINVVP